RGGCDICHCDGQTAKALRAPCPTTIRNAAARMDRRLLCKLTGARPHPSQSSVAQRHEEEFMSTSGFYAADVSRSELVIACEADDAEIVRVANGAAAIDAWLDRLPAGSLIGMEATGTYHRLLAARGRARSCAAYMPSPSAFRSIASSVGARSQPKRRSTRI